MLDICDVWGGDYPLYIQSIYGIISRGPIVTILSDQSAVGSVYFTSLAYFQFAWNLNLGGAKKKWKSNREPVLPLVEKQKRACRPKPNRTKTCSGKAP